MANARDVLTQSMAIFGYRKASLIAGTRPACAQAVPCWSTIRRLRKPRHEVGCLGLAVMMDPQARWELPLLAGHLCV